MQSLQPSKHTMHKCTKLNGKSKQTWPIITQFHRSNLLRGAFKDPKITEGNSDKKKGHPVHVAPACAVSGEASNHVGSYVHSLSLHFCKRLFSGLEPMRSWSQGNSDHVKIVTGM
jgi:hypothetical protein